MNFQNLLTIGAPDFYLDVAFRKAKDKTDIQRTTINGSRLDKSKTLELRRVCVVKDSLSTNFTNILKSFPSMSTLPRFYLELVKCTIDYPSLKKALGAVNWAEKKVRYFYGFYAGKMGNCRDIDKINDYRREFYGRVSSVVKQIKKELQFLEEARKIMKSYPAVKTEIKTAVIVGFPNVGKTTLMYKLTGSKPEINSYAFTTKSLNFSYLKHDDKKIQIVDAPGTLNRFEKMNSIEKQAHLAVKYLATVLVYVFDITEPFPLDEQIKLYENLKKENKEIIIYLSKTDILDKDKINSFRKDFNFTSNIESLKKKLAE